jgi:hypothetical protein
MTICLRGLATNTTETDRNNQENNNDDDGMNYHIDETTTSTTTLRRNDEDDADDPMVDPFLIHTDDEEGEIEGDELNLQLDEAIHDMSQQQKQPVPRRGAEEMTTLDGTMAEKARDAGKKRFSVYELDASTIQSIKRIEDLEDLVTQVENMPDLYQQDIGPLIKPLSRLTSMKQYGEKGAILTERLLLTCLGRLPAEIPDRYKGPVQGSKLPYPTSSLYSRAMIAWGNLANAHGAARAETLYKLQIQEYNREFEYVQSTLSGESPLHVEILAPPPDRRTYKSLIRAWAVSKTPTAPARALAVLEEMEKLSGLPELLGKGSTSGDNTTTIDSNVTGESQPSSNVTFRIDMPDLATYNVVISAYAKAYVADKPTNLEKIKALIQRLDKIAQVTGNHAYRLDAYSYTSILQAYGKWINYANAPVDPKYAQEIFDILKTIHDIIASPEYHAKREEPRFSEEYKRNMDGNSENPRDDRQIFFPLPISYAYGVAVDALLKTAPYHQNLLLADDIVVAMTGRKNRVNMDDPSSPLSIPETINNRVWPNNDTLMKVIKAWERSGDPAASKHVERLMYIIVVEYKYSRVHFFNSTMEDWLESNWKSTPDLLEAMLKRGFETATSYRDRPNGRSFAIVMKAWLRQRSGENARRIEKLLLRMLEISEPREGYEGHDWYYPREPHVRYLLTAWLNLVTTGHKYQGMMGESLYPAEHCEKIIMWLRGKLWSSKYLVGMYALAIRAWASQTIPSDDKDPPNPIQRASKLLTLLEQDNLTETKLLPAFPCNWVLEACCRPQPDLERRKEAYQTAISTFGKSHLNARTFALIVQVIKNQVQTLDSEHLKILEELFMKCCNKGLLTQEMILELLSVASIDTLQRLFGLSYSYAQLVIQARDDPSQRLDRIPNGLLLENLPVEWSCKAAPAQRKNARRNAKR